MFNLKINGISIASIYGEKGEWTSPSQDIWILVPSSPFFSLVRESILIRNGRSSSEEDKARITRAGGISTGTWVHEHVSLLWPSKAWIRYDCSHSPRHQHRRHFLWYLRRLWTSYQWDSSGQGLFLALAFFSPYFLMGNEWVLNFHRRLKEI